MGAQAQGQSMAELKLRCNDGNSQGDSLEGCRDQLMRLVTLGLLSDYHGPLDGQARILRVERAFRIRVIVRGMEVQHLAIVRKCLKSMGEAFGNEQCGVIGLCEQLAVPVKKSGGVFAHIHGNVKHFAAKTVDEFCFSIRRILKVHAANRAALSSERAIDLGDCFFAKDLRKLLRAEHAL